MIGLEPLGTEVLLPAVVIADLLRGISDAARRLGISGRPSAFLLWENSD